MRNFENAWLVLPAVVWLLVAGTDPRAAEGNPDVEGLGALVDEVGKITEEPALGDDAAAVVEARDAATAAIAAGRLHLALDELAPALVFGPALIYRAKMIDRIEDQSAFDAEWRARAALASDAEREAAAASCPDAPAHVRALAERALNRSARYYDAARAMAQATEPANGLFYLGRARSQLELQRICALLATGDALESPRVRTLEGELRTLERRTAEEFARPGAGTEKHGQFITLNAAIKEVGEMNASGLYHGALYEYLDAIERLGRLTAAPPEDRQAVLARANASARRFRESATDHGIVLAFLERALTRLEDEASEPAELASAAVIVDAVAPAYAAVIGTTPERPQPESAAGPVAITLVRWPYT